MPNDDEPDDKPRLTYHISIAVTADEGVELRTLATKLDRPVAWVGRQLLRDALAARKEK